MSVVLFPCALQKMPWRRKCRFVYLAAHQTYGSSYSSVAQGSPKTTKVCGTALAEPIADGLRAERYWRRHCCHATSASSVLLRRNCIARDATQTIDQATVIATVARTPPHASKTTRAGGHPQQQFYASSRRPQAQQPQHPQQQQQHFSRPMIAAAASAAAASSEKPQHSHSSISSTAACHQTPARCDDAVALGYAGAIVVGEQGGQGC